MELTPAARENFVEEYLAFQTAAEEIRNRFYDFLLAHDPKGLAIYNIYPFENSTVPLPVDYFKLVPHVEDIPGYLVFEGPRNEMEIEAAVLREIEESDDSPFTHETENYWNPESELYILVPDAYLHNPDGWEEIIRTTLSRIEDLKVSYRADEKNSKQA